MTSSNASTQNLQSYADNNVYSPTARFYHWLTVFFILVQFPIGVYMHYRAHDLEWTNSEGELKTGLFDTTTRLLYDSHKLLGLILLALVLARLYYRWSNGVPPPDQSLAPWQTALSKATHGLIYAALVAVPFLGYAGAAYLGATTLFGVFHVPSLVIEDKEFGRAVFEVHIWAAYGLLALLVLHLLAVAYHRFVRRDQVAARMLPGSDRHSATS